MSEKAKNPNHLKRWLVLGGVVVAAVVGLSEVVDRLQGGIPNETPSTTIPAEKAAEAKASLDPQNNP